MKRPEIQIVRHARTYGGACIVDAEGVRAVIERVAVERVAAWRADPRGVPRLPGPGEMFLLRSRLGRERITVEEQRALVAEWQRQRDGNVGGEVRTDAQEARRDDPRRRVFQLWDELDGITPTSRYEGHADPLPPSVGAQFWRGVQRSGR